MSELEIAMRHQMTRVFQVVAEQRLASANDGNITIRLDDERLLITPAGLYKRWLEPDDLLIIDLNGNLLEGKPGLRPTSEILLHLEVYRQRMDVNAALHAHPPYATALTVAEIPFPIDQIPEVIATLGEVPTAPYATPGTPELATSIRELIKTHNAMLLSHHGSLTVGRTIEETLISLERLEHAARVFFFARSMGKVTPLPEEEVTRLRRCVSSHNRVY
jgi:L-fuculose-phosphate aldolase